MNNMMMTALAVERFQERFAENLSKARTRAPLRRLLARAHFVAVRPGHARLHGLGEFRFLIHEGMPITVYRLTCHTTVAVDDLWCAA